jgi:hypothetical protein
MVVDEGPLENLDDRRIALVAVERTPDNPLAPSAKPAAIRANPTEEYATIRRGVFISTFLNFPTGATA